MAHTREHPLQQPLYGARHFTHATAIATLFVCVAAAFSLQFQSYLHAKEIMLCAALVPLSLLRARRGPLGWQDAAPYAPFAAAMLCGLVGGWLADTPWAIVIPECLRLALIFGTAVFVRDLAENEQTWAVLRIGFVASAFVVSVLALLQRLNLDGGLFPAFPHYDQPMYSVFGNQDALGGYLAMALPLLLGMVPQLRHRSSLPLQFFHGAAVSILCVTLALSECRSAWIAAAAGTAVLILLSRADSKYPWSSLRWIIPGATAAGVFILSPGPWDKALATMAASDVGTWSRLWFWEGAALLFFEHPILGAGPGGYEYWSPTYLGQASVSLFGFTHFHNEIHTLHVHNDLLELLASCGLAGAALAGWPLLRLARSGRREPALWAVLIAGLTFSFFYPLWSSTAHLLMLAVCWGRVVQVKEMQHGALAVRGWQGAAAAAIIITGYLACVLVPSYLLTQAEAVHMSGETREQVAAHYRAALRRSPFPHNAWRSYGVLLYEQRQYVEALDAFERASAGLDTGELHWFLAMAKLGAGDEAGAARSLQDCLLRWPWHEPARNALNSLANPARHLPVLPPPEQSSSEMPVRAAP